ncbi:MAG TPA: hypothetical protein DCE41_09310 [Cytophagales bacterium]|nr:hypothetical protein [Cytophagales bacterium]HAA21243.1 hypothetical protein [Cytophagales bacterium]HAP62431.1 hypothetical protein [Cytophagales bacterium]
MVQNPKSDHTLLQLVRLVMALVSLTVVLISLAGLGYWAIDTGVYAQWLAEGEEPDEVEATPQIVDGIDTMSGLIAEGEYEIVRAACTACHSGKLVTQNRATAEGWTQMIRWMQETQELWDLGEQEAVIVDYLATYYAPEAQGRRAPLNVEEWYVLED